MYPPVADLVVPVSRRPGSSRFKHLLRAAGRLLTLGALTTGVAGAAGYDLQFVNGVDATSGAACNLTLNSRCRFNNVVVGAGTSTYQRDVIVTVTRLNAATLGAFDTVAPVFSGTNTPSATATQFFAPSVQPTQNTPNITGWAEFTFDFVVAGGAVPGVGAGTATLPGTIWLTSFDTDANGTLREFVEFVGGGVTTADTGLSAGTTLSASTAVNGGIQYQSGTVGQPDITTDNTYKGSAIYNNPSTFKLVYGARTGANGSTAGGRLTAFDFFRPDAVLPRAIVDGYKSVRLTTDADASGSVTAGDTLTYTLTYVNTGNTGVTGFQITDALPGNVTFTTGAQTVTAGTGSTASRNTAYTGSGTATGLLAAGAVLASNSAITVTIPVVVGAAAAGTGLGNQASATGGGIAATASDNVDTTTTFAPSVTASAGWAPVPTGSVTQNQTAALSATTAAVSRKSDLGVTKTDYTATALSGSPVTYTIRVVNNGPDAVTGAAVTDTVPGILTGVTWTCTAQAGSSCAAASGSGSVSTTVNLANAGTATFTLRGTLTATSGTLVNTASVAVPAGTSDLVPGNNSATDTDTVALNFCAARGGTLGSNLFASSGNFGTTTGGAGTIGAALPAGRTTYAYLNGFPPNDGQYTIINQPATSGFNAWYQPPDHTSGTTSGNMMLVNADTANAGVFYQETLTVSPNTNYEFSAWIVNLIANNAAALPNISLEVDRAGFDDDHNAATADGSEGQRVFTTGDLPNLSEAIWKYYGLLINSGASTQMTLRFRNNNLGGGGNDLAIDDLSFTPCNGARVGSVSGTLYKDRNNSGTFEATGLDSRLGANVAVSLTDASNGITVSVNTDASGNYSFVNVPAGTYKIWVATVDPDLGGLTPRTPTNAESTGVTLASGANLTGQDFGFNAAGLILTKQVRNCGVLAPGAACPAGATFGTTGTGRPGEVLEYCVAYTNPGGAGAANVVLSDLVPQNTRVDPNAYGAGRGLNLTVGATTTQLTSVADSDNGELTASQLTLRVGGLTAGASGQICFRSVIR